MEENTIRIEKSFIEKMAPFVLVALLAFLAYFGFTKLNLGNISGGEVILNQQIQKTPTKVDVEFLNSEAFKNLKFIPDSSVFDPATGEIPKGREDPFAPLN
jgi:hypothetical protein